MDIFVSAVIVKAAVTRACIKTWRSIVRSLRNRDALPMLADIVPSDKSAFWHKGLSRSDKDIVGTVGKAVIVDNDSRLLLQKQIGELDRRDCLSFRDANHKQATCSQVFGWREIEANSNFTVETRDLLVLA